MNKALVVTLGCSLLLINLLVFVFELAARELSFGVHATVSLLFVSIVLCGLYFSQHFNLPVVVSAILMALLILLFGNFSLATVTPTLKEGVALLTTFNGLMFWGVFSILFYGLLLWLKKSSAPLTPQLVAGTVALTLVVGALYMYMNRRPAVDVPQNTLGQPEDS